MGHHLTIVDRGLGHIHRWRATCACGWIAVNRRTRADANRLYRSHLEGSVSKSRRRPVAARPVTPPDDLPESLR